MSTEDMVQRLPSIRCVGKRIPFILDQCYRKRVLHLGCTESPRSAAAFAGGSLLHMRLREVASEVVGVDLDKGSIEYLRGKGIDNLYVGDAERLHEVALSGRFDVIVAGEIIEHLSNPGLCLAGMHELLAAGGRAIVSVPNSFSLRHVLAVAFRRRELVMPDHTAYYSWSTLTELLRRGRLRAVEFHTYLEGAAVCDRGLKRAAKNSFAAVVGRTFPQLAEGLIVVAEGMEP